ncbi:hypothetical protein BJ970_004493 [Saccharopolyspora phatthalungensis]|uniref:Uncharacterized protein n=1 Tax=Saccharopolyspora phatthalungensis TaxID=664693 RepID=A0A840QEF5_9PSEU|nr:hypothetical protein [Saccharopolyspora phatthalungensis]
MGVALVAAGIAGLATAKLLLRHRFTGLLWKVYRREAGVLNFKALLTHLGEALFRHRMAKFPHGRGNGLRRMLLNSSGSVSVRQFGLREKDFAPRGRMEHIVRGAIGLVAEGFFPRDRATVLHGRRDWRTPLPRHQDHRLIPAPRRRGPQRPRTADRVADPGHAHWLMPVQPSPHRKVTSLLARHSPGRHPPRRRRRTLTRAQPTLNPRRSNEHSQPPRHPLR